MKLNVTLVFLFFSLFFSSLECTEGEVRYFRTEHLNLRDEIRQKISEKYKLTSTDILDEVEQRARELEPFLNKMEALLFDWCEYLNQQSLNDNEKQRVVTNIIGASNINYSDIINNMLDTGNYNWKNIQDQEKKINETLLTKFPHSLVLFNGKERFSLFPHKLSPLLQKKYDELANLKESKTYENEKILKNKIYETIKFFVSKDHYNATRLYHYFKAQDPTLQKPPFFNTHQIIVRPSSDPYFGEKFYNSLNYLIKNLKSKIQRNLSPTNFDIHLSPFRNQNSYLYNNKIATSFPFRPQLRLNQPQQQSTVPQTPAFPPVFKKAFMILLFLGVSVPVIIALFYFAFKEGKDTKLGEEIRENILHPNARSLAKSVIKFTHIKDAMSSFKNVRLFSRLRSNK